MSSIPAIKALRAMRCLRPLRVISRYSGTKQVVNSLLRALPGVANVCLLVFSLTVIFGILGVQLFMGGFAQCVVSHGARTELACERLARTHPEELAWDSAGHCVLVDVPSRAACEAHDHSELYAWRNPPVGNFDDMGNALLVLFEMATFEQWPTVM